MRMCVRVPVYKYIDKVRLKCLGFQLRIVVSNSCQYRLEWYSLPKAEKAMAGFILLSAPILMVAEALQVQRFFGS